MTYILLIVVGVLDILHRSDERIPLTGSGLRANDIERMFQAVRGPMHRVEEVDGEDLLPAMYVKDRDDAYVIFVAVPAIFHLSVFPGFFYA